MIAITGASGLLGGHLVAHFATGKTPVIAIGRSAQNGNPRHSVQYRQADVLDPFSLGDALEGATTVIHCAARVSFNPAKRDEIMKTNVEGTHNVVNACLEASIPNLVHISSVAALGRRTGTKINEESRWVDDDVTDYSRSKHLAELEAMRGLEEGLTVSVVNPSVILSPADPRRSSGALFGHCLAERKFYPGGNLCYVDVRDVVNAVDSLFKNPRPGENFILDAGAISFKNFFEEACKRLNRRPPSMRVGPSLSWWIGLAEEFLSKLTGRDPLVTRQTARLAHQKYEYDNKKAKGILGLKFHSLEETLDWCCGELNRNNTTN